MKPLYTAMLLIACTSAVYAAAPIASTGPVIGSIHFEGNKQVSVEDITKILPYKVGDPYIPGQQPVAAQLVKSFLNARGFLESTVSMESKVENNKGRIDFAITEGPLYRFGTTTIEGLTKVRENPIRMGLHYKEGDPFVKTKLFQSQSEVFSTGYFEDITFTVSTTSAKIANVLIQVRERELKWLKGGVGYGSEEKERVTLSLTHENFMRRGYKLEGVATWSRIWLEYKGEFVNRYLFGTRTEERLTGTWRHEKREGYDLEQLRIENTLGRKLSAHTAGSFNYRVDRNVVFNLDPDIAENTPERSDTRAINFGLNRDTTDNYFYPLTGSRHNAVVERAGGFLGGINNFHKASYEARIYRRMYKKLIGGAALRTGVIEEYDPSIEVPIFERFFTGGANSVRGYRERGVGPKDKEGNPLGGKYLLGGTTELRFPLFWKFTGATFVDGGMVGFRFDDVWVPEWKYGAGVGIRLITPVGPIRLDYGQKLNPDSNDDDHWRFHFSLGESF